jgi:hypothetical protein
MRVAIMTVSLAALMLGVWTAEAAAPTPPKCSAADTQRRAILFSGDYNSGGSGYARYCGHGRAVVRMRGKTYTIEGGRCHGNTLSPRWVWFGLFAQGFPGGRGFSVVVEPGNRSGRNAINDSVVQLNGRNLAATGTAVVAKGLKSATFSLVTRGSSPTKITGSWTCG